MRENQTLQLPDGRKLGFAEYGAPDGRPVLFFHGSPSSRLFHHPNENIAIASRARIISIDRPGYGLSSFKPGRKLIDWPDDIKTMADALGLDCFAVAGISAGGPYVAACAYKIPSQIKNATIISGVGPTDTITSTKKLYRKRQIAITLARKAPWMLRPLIWWFQNPQRNPERYFRKTFEESSLPDQKILSQPEIKSMLISNWLEGTRQGVRGFAWEGVILAHPWGFRLEEIDIPVNIWHGDADVSMPLSMAKQIANTISNCNLKVIQKEGHFLFFKFWEEILCNILTEPPGGSNEN